MNDILNPVQSDIYYIKKYTSEKVTEYNGGWKNGKYHGQGQKNFMEKLSKYFIAHAKKIKVNSTSINDIKGTINSAKNKSNKEKFNEIYKLDNNFNVGEIAELLNVSRQTIYRFKNELENE
jgi:hypothetical protein